MSEYQVLARKYRPKTLDELIGQNVLVKILTNAIEQDRIPHAFLLTGIRGVGKTSTARIIAKCLNYRGADGKQDMSAKPTEDCDQCKAIEESRHPDVIEMDAASRTGVNDIREIIESVNYAPSMGRYKIYIIDEVHMLSKSAFNALLKTLEEPPEHCKFIFATTEVRKIPVTILSRCMRFDLPRVTADVLSKHFVSISDKEGMKLEDGASQLLSYAAEGSVRDGLSLLDQAIGSVDDKTVTKDHVERMLGTSDRGQIYDLLEALVTGKAVDALNLIKESYYKGSEPLTIFGDLLQVVHFVTKQKINAVGEADAMSQTDKERGQAVADKVQISVLTRLWQMLLKGVNEMKQVADPLAAAEMICIRIAYAADMPPPNDLIKKIESGEASSDRITNVMPSSAPTSAPVSQIAAPVVRQKTKETIASLEELIAVCEKYSEHFLSSYLKGVSLVKFDAAQKCIEFCPGENTPNDLAGNVKRVLNDWTLEPWMVAVSQEQGATPISKVEEQNEQNLHVEVREDEIVSEIFNQFPNAKIVEITRAEDVEQQNNVKQLKG